MEETAEVLTSKQKRRAKKRALTKAMSSAGVADTSSVELHVSSTVKVTAPTIPKALVPIRLKKIVRKIKSVTESDLVAEVATPADLESDLDAGLMAEIAAMVKECQSSNPDADDEAEDVLVKSHLPTKVSGTASKKKLQPVVEAPVQQQPIPAAYSKSSAKESNGAWNFAVDYNDHFETPLVAYTDILPMLLTLAESLGKNPAELVIYDPYYCQGGMVQMLAGMGFSKVVNRNRDFYADIAMKGIPDYDILVTNPPYSGEHKPKLLEYLLTSSSRRPSVSASETANRYLGKPFALLLPAYTASKSYWREFVSDIEAKIDYSGPSPSKAVLYVLPPESYEYRHPEGTGKDAPPFYSAWFVGGFRGVARVGDVGDSTHTTDLTDSIRSALLMRQMGGPKNQIPRNLRVLSSVDDMVSAGIITDKRPNPRNRKKFIKQRTGGAAPAPVVVAVAGKRTVFTGGDGDGDAKGGDGKAKKKRY